MSCTKHIDFYDTCLVCEIEALQSKLALAREALEKARYCIDAMASDKDNCACEAGGNFGPGFVCGVHSTLEKVEAALEKMK